MKKKYSLIIIVGLCLMACKNPIEKVQNQSLITTISQLQTLSDSALSIKLLADNWGNIPDSSDFAVASKVYWNQNNLCFSVQWKDDSLTQNDNIEFFIADSVGGRNLAQFIISGFSDSLRTTIWDLRSTRTLTAEPLTYIATKNVDGTFFFSMPFSCIGINAEVGKSFALQIVANDTDSPNSRQSMSWNSYHDTYRNTLAMDKVVLAQLKSSNSNVSVKSIWQNDTTLVIKIIPAVEELKKLNIQASTKCNPIFTQSQLCTIVTLTGLIHRKQENLSVMLEYDGQIITQINPIISPKNLNNIHLADFEEEFDRFAFLEKDKKPNPEVLFVGHSMFRYWASLEEDFAQYNALNRGFGGSRLENILENYDLLFKKNYPLKAIVIVNGGNDVNTGDTPKNAFNEFKTLVNKLHTDFPNVKIVILSHPEFYYSFFTNLIEYDNLMIEYVQNTPWLTFADIRNALPTEPKELDKCLLPDHVHLSPLGYSKLKPIVENTLKP
jgi:lysophospholipase L1-like esterase